MGFFDKVKQFMNIGGVKLELLGVGPDIARKAGKFTGKVKLNSKSDQHVKKINVEFKRKITTYKNVPAKTQSAASGMSSQSDENTKVREDVLGTWAINQPFDMKAGESKEMDFEVKFHVPSTGGNLEVGGARISINIGGSNNEKREDIEHTVSATADVDKAGFDPGDSVSVRLV